MPDVDALPQAHVLVTLPDNIEPFYVQFAIQKTDATVDVKFEPGELLGKGVVTVQRTGHSYGLVIAMLNLRLADPAVKAQFPARAIYFMR